MSLPPIQTRQYEAEALTEQFVFAGTLEPFGMLMIYLNDPERKSFRLKQASGLSLDPASTLDKFQADEVWFRREEVIAIHLITPVSSDTLRLLPRAAKLRLILPRFVVQATFYSGPDTRLGEIFDASGYWAPATEAQLYPLLPLRHPVFHEAKTLLINKRFIRFYQAVGEPPHPAG